MDKNNELNTNSSETNNVVIPVDNNAYAQVGTTLDQSSSINNSIIEQLNDNASYDNSMEYYTNAQTNLNKSINNYTDIVENYNQISNEIIDNGEGVSSFEDQLNNSQDIAVYTQQPKKTVEMSNINNNNYPMQQPYNYGNESYNPNDMGYTNNQNMGNNGYANYDNTGYNNYQNINYNNGFNDNYNMGYNNNGYVNDNYNGMNNNNYPMKQQYNYEGNNYNPNGMGYINNPNMDNSGNSYNNSYNNFGYQNMNYNNGYNDNYNMGYNNTPNNNGYLDTSYNTNNNIKNNNYNSANDDIDTTGNSTSIKTKHRKTIGPEAFDKKMKKNLRPFNFILAIIYILIIGIIGYFGYQYWLTRNDFYFVKDKMNLAKDSSFQEKVYVKGKLENNKNYEWKSDNEAIITVDNDGKIVGKAEGTANIKVTNKKTKTTKTIIVKVIDVDVKQLSTKDKEKVVYIGNTYTIVPLINGQSSLTIDLKWENSNDSVATVDSEGVVTPKKAGSTTVTISIPNTEFKTSIIIIVAQKK